MKKRRTGPGGARGAWLTAGRSAAGAVLVVVAASACTAGGSSAPTIFTPTPLTNPSSGPHSGTRTPSPNGQTSRSSGSSASASATGRQGASAPSSPRASGSSHAAASSPASSSAHASGPAPASASASDTPSRPPSASSPASPATHKLPPANPGYPADAPETGGGGTAGLQDTLLFGAGGLSVLAGLGSLAYRRRLARRLSAGDRARQSPPDREPADR